MIIRRAVPNLTTDRLDESRAFYVNVLGFEVAMDMGWIVTLASPDNPTAQISLFPPSEATSPIPSISVEVGDVDEVHDAAARAGAEVVYPLTNEEWGVRRFFVKDPSGTVVNVMAHRDGE
jgi:catechol 2,3-dioxygenase-like lactoylglutathione lyase family enzyme